VETIRPKNLQKSPDKVIIAPCGAYVFDVTTFTPAIPFYSEKGTETVEATATVGCANTDCPIKARAVAQGRMPLATSALGTVFGMGHTPDEAVTDALSHTRNVVGDCK
jgi:hypothetical protein